MNKKQYADMLKDICETHKSGGDVSACIEKYNELYKYVYVYNDAVIKLLLGSPENEAITIDFLNAALQLYGSDCIDHLTFENLERPGVFVKTTASDIVAKDQRLDRIVLEVQYIEDETFNDRLVFYAAKHTVANLVHGQGYMLRNLNLISLQMFNGFPESDNYLHTIRLKNQANEEFFKKQTITLVEVRKFLEGGYDSDNSRLAQWLRVFDSLNNERPIPNPKDPRFALLQKKAELSKFTEEFLVSEAMKMSDREYELYVEKKHTRAEERLSIAKAMLAEGDSVEKVARIVKLPEADVLAIQAKLAAHNI